MSAKSLACWSVVAVIVTLGLVLWTVPAYAGANGPLEDSSCLNCHENLYYLYDMGKWYCINEASTRCVDCHDGNPATMEKIASHEGLIAYPVINDDMSKCQQCHLQDYAAHVQKFDQIAGISPVIYVAEPYKPIPSKLAVSEQPVIGATQPYIWQLIGIALLIAVLGGVVLFCLWSKHYSQK